MIGGAVDAQEMLHQHWHIAAALAQRWQEDGHHVHAIVQILTKLASVHHFFQLLVGGGDQPEIYFLRRFRAQPLHRVTLQHAQQLALQLQRQRADLIQK